MREEERTNARNLEWSIREATHPEWNIQDGSTGLERQGKVWVGVYGAASRGGGGGGTKKRRGEHEQEEEAEESNRRGRDRVAAEGRDGGKGGGGRGSAKTQRGDSGDRTERGRKEVRRSSGERSQLRSTPAARRPVTRAVVVGSIPTSSARRAHLKTSIVPGLGRWDSCNRSWRDH